MLVRTVCTYLTFTLIATVLLRCKAGEYDPTGHIYPWPLPEDRQPIFFSLIVSFGESFNSSGVVPGVNVALDVINSNESNLLEGYSLHYVLSDSQVGLSNNLLNYVKRMIHFYSVQGLLLWMFSFVKFCQKLSTQSWLS